MQLVLASNSPRRKELLALWGRPFSVSPADLDEGILPGERPAAYVARLAESKACSVGERAFAGEPAETPAGAPGGRLVIAADTTVAVDGKILGKPADASEAAAMLALLRGRVHQVYTALAVLRCADGVLFAETACSDVSIRAYSDEEVQAYIESGDPLDKAGAYAIQHAGFHPVDCLAGCYTNVMGLPLCRLFALLEQAGFSAPPGLPHPCLYSGQEKCSFGPDFSCSPYEASQAQ